MKMIKAFAAFILCLIALQSSSQIVVLDDSLYQGIREEKIDIGASTGKSVMERETIVRQLKMFLHKKNVKFSDAGLDVFLQMSVFMNNKNEVEAITYSFTKNEFNNGKFYKINFSLAERDSMANLLQLKTLLPEFGEGLVFKRKYLDSHRHGLFFDLKGIRPERELKSLAEIFGVEAADTVSSLNLKGQDLANISRKDIKRFKNAKWLFLSNCHLEKMPRWVRKFKKMESLDLSGNYLTAENVKFRRNKSLHTLNLQDNGFTTLPKSLKKLKKLDNLVAGNNSLYEVGDFRFDKLKNLKDLNFYNACLLEIPPAVLNHKKLENLDLYFNNINYLPKEISQLKTLKTLAVSWNDMWKLPAEIAKMPNLKTLFAHHNQIDRVPDLPNSIEQLDIGYNTFSSFPDNISQYPNLKIIDFNKNELTSVFDEKLLPEKLENLYIKSNPVFKSEGISEEALDFVKRLEDKGIVIN